MFIVLSIYKQLPLWDRTGGFVLGVRKNHSNSQDDALATQEKHSCTNETISQPYAGPTRSGRPYYDGPLSAGKEWNKFARPH